MPNMISRLGKSILVSVCCSEMQTTKAFQFGTALLLTLTLLLALGFCYSILAELQDSIFPKCFRTIQGEEAKAGVRMGVRIGERDTSCVSDSFGFCCVYFDTSEAKKWCEYFISPEEPYELKGEKPHEFIPEDPETTEIEVAPKVPRIIYLKVIRKDNDLPLARVEMKFRLENVEESLFSPTNTSNDTGIVKLELPEVEIETMVLEYCVKDTVYSPSCSRNEWEHLELEPGIKVYPMRLQWINQAVDTVIVKVLHLNRCVPLPGVIIGIQIAECVLDSTYNYECLSDSNGEVTVLIPACCRNGVLDWRSLDRLFKGKRSGGVSIPQLLREEKYEIPLIEKQVSNEN